MLVSAGKQTSVSLDANFEARPTSGRAPLTVQFTNLSRHRVRNWLRTFGDEATSTDKNPPHTYSVPGNYTVPLPVSSRAGPLILGY